jgi:hypothetical protein
MLLKFEGFRLDRLTFDFYGQVFSMRIVSSSFIREEIIVICPNCSSKQEQSGVAQTFLQPQAAMVLVHPPFILEFGLEMEAPHCSDSYDPPYMISTCYHQGTVNYSSYSRYSMTCFLCLLRRPKFYFCSNLRHLRSQ